MTKKRATHRIKEDLVQIIYSRLPEKSTVKATELAILAAELINQRKNKPEIDVRIDTASLELPWSDIKRRRRLVRDLAGLNLGWLELEKSGDGCCSFWLVKYCAKPLADADILFGFNPVGAEKTKGFKTPYTIEWTAGPWRAAVAAEALDHVKRKPPHRRVAAAMKWLEKFYCGKKPPITRRSLERHR